MTTKPTKTVTARRTAKIVVYYVYIDKQQLCTYITLFCTFLCRRCTTTTWNVLISRARVMESRWTQLKKCRFLFLNLDNDRYGRKENFVNIYQIKWNWIRSGNGGISYIPWCFAANFCLLSVVERAFEGFEGDFQRPEFQDAAHPR